MTDFSVYDKFVTPISRVEHAVLVILKKEKIIYSFKEKKPKKTTIGILVTKFGKFS